MLPSTDMWRSQLVRRVSSNLIRVYGIRKPSAYWNSEALCLLEFGSCLSKKTFRPLPRFSPPPSLSSTPIFLASCFSVFYFFSLGFSTDRHGWKLRLVYKLMPNRSLQEALLDWKCPELMVWKKRFSVVLDVALGLEYLHHVCDSPVIHGDVKPSNVLLDSDSQCQDWRFWIGEVENRGGLSGWSFGGGRARGGGGGGRERGKGKRDGDDNGSILEESVSLNVVTGGLEEGSVARVLCGEDWGFRTTWPERGFIKRSIEGNFRNNSRWGKYNVDRK